MKFVEQHRADILQLGIVEDLPREDAFGDHFDPGVARDLRAKADAIADGFADAFAQRFRHPLGAGAGCDAPRLQHDDLFALQPRRIEQSQRHTRGLAGARRRHQHRGVAGVQRASTAHRAQHRWAGMYRRFGSNQASSRCSRGHTNLRCHTRSVSRGSILLARRWIAGSGPAITVERTLRPIPPLLNAR